MGILEEGMSLHGNRVSADLKPFHENLEKRFKEMKIKTAPFKKVGALFWFLSSNEKVVWQSVNGYAEVFRNKK